MELVKRHPHQRILRSSNKPDDRASASQLFVRGLPRRPARPPEGRDPPRSQADQRLGHSWNHDAGRRCRRSSTSESPRRPNQPADREDALHRVPAASSGRRVHERPSRPRSAASTSTRAPTSTRWASSSTSSSPAPRRSTARRSHGRLRGDPADHPRGRAARSPRHA